MCGPFHKEWYVNLIIVTQTVIYVLDDFHGILSVDEAIRLAIRK